MTCRMVLAFVLAGLSPAQAQEPLLLRIRSSTPDAVAYAEREAVWERSERRARIAIASVCNGCLLPQSANPTPRDPPPADTGVP